MRYYMLSLLWLSFLLMCSACFFKSDSSQSVVIRVGDESVTVGEIKSIVNITSLENEIPKEAVWTSINSLVDRIVDDSLVLEYGRKKGIILSEIELEMAIQGIVKDYPENTFRETLLTNCIDYDEWKERLGEKLLIEKIVKKQTESLAPISYQSIKSYYQDRGEDFKHPPRAKFLHIVTKTRKEAQAILVRLKGEEDMAKIVEEQSVYSGMQGDHAINWTTRDMLPRPLSDIVFSIPVGRVSTINETQYGFHIIEVLERQRAGRKELLEVRGEIEKRLLSEAIETHYAVWLNQLRNDYTVTVNYSLLDRVRASEERT